jgi:hypothetical protein
MAGHNASSMIFFVIGIVVFVLGLSLTSVAISNANIQKPIASGIATAATRINDLTISESPLYIEFDNTTSRKPVVVNETTTHATEVKFSGHGTARGVNYTDSGKGLIIPRDNGVINAKGYVTMITSTGDKASAIFQEIGHPAVDANNTIMITASGTAFFDSKATGNLAFLSNSVAIYKDIIYKNGTDKVIAWEWK